MKAFFVVPALGILSAAALCAAAYVYEPFAYPDGQRLGKCYTGTGFRGGSWNDTTGERGNAAVAPEGLKFKGLSESGNAVALTFVKNAGNESLDISRSVMSVEDAAKPVWISMRVRFAPETSRETLSNITAFFRVVGGDRMLKYRFGIADQKPNIQHSGGKPNERNGPAFAVNPGVTYLLVAHFPGVKEGSAPSGKCTLWVLESGLPSVANAPEGAPALEALLDQAALSKVSAPMTAAVLRAGDVMHIGLWGRKNAVASVTMDEIRFGVSPADVLPLAR